MSLPFFYCADLHVKNSNSLIFGWHKQAIKLKLRSNLKITLHMFQLRVLYLIRLTHHKMSGKLFASQKASACLNQLQQAGVGLLGAHGLPDWHFAPIFYSAAAQLRAPPDGPCLQASPRLRHPTRPLEWSPALSCCPSTQKPTQRGTDTRSHQHAEHPAPVSAGPAAPLTSPFCFHSYD